jgi:hypothetical protein
MTRARDLTLISRTITPTNTSSVGLTVQGSSGQTANLVEFKNSSGAVMSSIRNDGQLYVPGNIVQVQVKRTDSLLSYTTGTSTSGVEFSDLRVSITPKFANSLIICNFQIHGEGSSTHDYDYKIWKNGSVPSGTYAGHNSVSGLQFWSGFAQALPYEGDYNSTPFTQTMTYHDIPGSTSTVFYAPGVQDSYGTSRVYYVNRTVGSAGTGGYETGVSMSVAMEIAQ